MTKEDPKIGAFDQVEKEMIESLNNIKDWVTKATLSINENYKRQSSPQLDILKDISNVIDQTLKDSTDYSVQRRNIASQMHHLVYSERTRINIENVIRVLISATLIPVILVMESFSPNRRAKWSTWTHELFNHKLIPIQSTYSLEKNFSEDNVISDLKKLKRYAEKLANARNDDERYQPLKDIMDEMIIMLAKASSMFMPPAVVDITIKALEMIGGHLADIIREDFEKIVNKPNNSSELAEWTEKKQGLEISINNMQLTCKDQEHYIMLKLTEQAVMLGLLGRSNYDTTEEFIKQLEGSIKSIQTNDEQAQELRRAAQYNTTEGIKSLCKKATENIQLYRDGKAASKEMQKQSEDLKNLDKNIEQKKKAPERKSIKDMRSELKNKLDITYKEKVHREKQEYQNKFKR
jgi:hypothetical protein